MDLSEGVHELGEFVCFNEFGVPAGQMNQVVTELRDLRGAIDDEGRGVGAGDNHALELYTFGANDLVTIHFIPQLFRLAVVNSTAPVTHQRAYGAFDPGITDPPSRRDPLRLSRAELLKTDEESPFHAIIHLKVDPLANLVGDQIPNQVLQRVAGFVRRRFDDFDAAATAWISGSGRSLEAASSEWPVAAGPDLGGLRLMPLAGLDSAEVIIVARAPRIEWLARLCWALRSLRIGHLLTEADVERRWSPAFDRFAKLLCSEQFAEPLTARMLCASPLWAYSSSTVGVPISLVEGRRERRRDPIACQKALVLRKMRALPGGNPNTNQELDQLDALCASPQDSAAERMIPLRFSLLGCHDILYAGPLGSAVCADAGGRTVLVREEPAAAPVRAYTHRQILDLLSERAPCGAADVPDPPRYGYTQETCIAVMAFPPGFPRPDLLPERAAAATPEHAPAAPTAQARFEWALLAARKRWLDHRRLATASAGDAPPSPGRGGKRRSAYERLIADCQEGAWSYSPTNGAMNLLVSLVTILANRAETENYLELVIPLIGWLDGVHQCPGALNRRASDRIYKHLDRLMHARSHRDSPTRMPGVSRAFEARAGYVLPHDAFHAYLSDLFARRVDAACAPLVVDGTDASLRVKFAMDTGIFLVSALRLHQPVLWPSLAHEVEHVFFTREASPAWIDAAKRCARKLGRQGSIGLPEGRLSYMSVIEHLRDLSDWTRGPAGNQLLEVGCDVAIADSGALVVGDAWPDTETLKRRLLATLWPNFILDIHESWRETDRAGRSLDRHELSTRVQHLAVVYGRRIAGVFALLALRHPSSLGQKAPVEADDAAGAEIRNVLKSTLWAYAMQRLLENACGTRRGKRDRHSGPASYVDAARNVEAARDTLLRELDTRHEWQTFLLLLDAARSGERRTLYDEDRSALDGVAAHLLEVMAANDAEHPGAVHAPVFPRGGLDPHSAAARASNEMVHGLYSQLRRAVLRHRLEAITRFLDPVLEDRDPGRSPPGCGGICAVSRSIDGPNEMERWRR